MELVRNTSISEVFDGRHIDAIALNEADGKKESNQLKVLLIISNESMLLERIKSKSDGKIDEVQFTGMKSRCSQQKKGKTDRKNEGISVG